MFASLRARITLACVAIVLVALVVVSSLNAWTTFRNTHADESDYQQQLLRSNAAQLSQWFSVHINAVSGIAANSLENFPDAALTQAMKQGDFSKTYVGFPDGRFRYFDGRPGRAGYDPRQRGWYQAAVATGKPVITAPYVGATSGELEISVAAPVYRGSRLVAVVSGDLPLAFITRTVAELSPTPNSFAFLIDDTGTLIAHPDDALVLKPMSALASALTPETLASSNRLVAAGQSALVVDIQQRDYRMFSAELDSAGLGDTGWRLALALDVADSDAPLYAQLWTTLAMTLLVLLGAAAVMSWIASRSLRGLALVRDALVDIAAGEGDLTRRIQVSGRDEVAEIGNAFNRFVSTLNGVLSEIRLASGAVQTAAAEISQGSQDLSSRTEQAAANLQETSASMEQISGTVAQSADSAHEADGLAKSASEVARRGGEVIGEVVTTMQGIDDDSRKITEIVSVMDSIAFQTNLLALNASVEAARAGEQGRGFAVVAGEVRTLAQRSSEASREIATLISSANERTRNGAEQVRVAGSTMNEIVASVMRVSEVIGEISHATQEQNHGVGQVSSAVAELDQVTQQNAALVEESAAAADALSEQSARLAEMVGRFRLDGPAQPPAMAPRSAGTLASQGSSPRAARPVASEELDWQAW
ncbi:HAMP domain-containing protein [Cobetia sp. 4B]|uniref:methyl-accepting chemotaxis protein n=1 Tax=Cobetia sp. 4B TaxID=2758724 RepID=UPI001C778A52|nr:methyl-accepting chemotaxis protein [Cobetia sp. 4B]MBR9755039.1 HAMP domain-containing protein [Gammaproteobacteria bacterium]QWN37041.1 HAMP domain-containing protein [Cobetia sp. 4B]